MYNILLVIHSIIVLFLIIMVLIQRTDSDGLGGLGGGGGNQFMTGRATANLFTKTTAVLAAAFMVTSLMLTYIATHANTRSIVDTVPVEQSLPKDGKKGTVKEMGKTPDANATATKDKAPEPLPPQEKPKTEAPAVPKPE